MARGALIDLKLARLIGHKTQWELARSTKINQTKISLIENGHVEPTAKDRKTIARALGFGVEEIAWNASHEVEESNGN